mgnify:FL=1
MRIYRGTDSAAVTTPPSDHARTNIKASLKSLLTNVPDIRPLDVSALSTSERTAKLKEVFGDAPAYKWGFAGNFNVNDPFGNAATTGPAHEPEPKEEDYLPDWYPSSPQEEELQEVESYRWIMEDEECLDNWIAKGTICRKMDSSHPLMRKPKSSTAAAPTLPIDIVFTWVNGSDPLHQQARKYWLYCLTIHTEARNSFCPQGYDKATGKLANETEEELQKKMDRWLANAYPLVQYQGTHSSFFTRPAAWRGGMTDASIGVVDRRFQ